MCLKQGAAPRPTGRRTSSRERARYRDGESRLPAAEDADARQRQLTRLGNAADGAGLALLMQARSDEAGEWFRRAAARYRESFADAPPGSWGRPIGAIKALVLADDWAGAEEAARWALEAGAERSADSPIGRYAAALALLVLGRRRAGARPHADAIRTRDDFPTDVGDALAYLAAQDVVGYTEAVEAVLESFESREEYLEDIPVADTVLVLQALAAAPRARRRAQLAAAALVEVDRRRRVQHRRDHERRRRRILRLAHPLRELLDQLDRPLRRDPRRHLGGAELAARAVLGPASLDLVEHRRAQVARRARREQRRRDAHRPRDCAVRLLAALAAVGQLDQARAQQHPDVEVQVAGIDAEAARELAIRQRARSSPAPSVSSTRSRSGCPSALAAPAGRA